MLITKRFLVLSLVFLLMASVGVPVRAQQTLKEVKKERGCPMPMCWQR
jgi:hypothetical protein